MTHLVFFCGNNLQHSTRCPLTLPLFPVSFSRLVFSLLFWLCHVLILLCFQAGLFTAKHEVSSDGVDYMKLSDAIHLRSVHMNVSRHCSTLPHTATHCSTLQYTTWIVRCPLPRVRQYEWLESHIVASHCNALATFCNTLHTHIRCHPYQVCHHHCSAQWIATIQNQIADLVHPPGFKSTSRSRLISLCHKCLSKVRSIHLFSSTVYSISLSWCIVAACVTCVVIPQQRQTQITKGHLRSQTTAQRLQDLQVRVALVCVWE